MKPNVLFLCTGNSCRSQMAEGFLRRYAEDRFDVYSAGLDPRPVHPLAIQVMDEIGIDISRQHSKGIDTILGRLSFKYAIFVCHRAEQNCPSIYPFALEKLSWSFDEPAASQGDDEEKKGKFREVRNQIDEKIKDWLESLGEDEKPS